ncbi:MAG TPA: tyrosine-type recombinase/integrase [Candidatus Angelobacter sp.]|nr:tyrosine-type recombinase/integrase [Candidatus Angelobacter sp.]
MQLNHACTDFLTGYFSTHDRSAKTKAAYESDLLQFQAFAGGENEVESLAGTTIERFAADLRQNRYSPASIRRKIVVLKVFCGYWVRKGLLTESPFWRVKLSIGRIEQLPRSLTEREMRALLSRAAQNQSSELQNGQPSTQERLVFGRYRFARNLALIDILFATGMRVGEASTLNLDDFFESEGMFKIKGKGGRARLAFAVDKKSLQIQKDHLRARKQIETESSALFLNSSRKRLSTQGIANVVAQLRREAGIERHVTPHMLRHTVATLLLQNGADIRVVQEFLGHASIATTQRYTHISKEHLIAVLQKRHPSFNLRTGD